jgi:hypothetical protein
VTATKTVHGGGGAMDLAVPDKISADESVDGLLARNFLRYQVGSALDRFKER